ncbi:hypothetical protein [uncultured Pontibacter sp.]|uniref:hypothetical protein n=1 Tax=uncultured Pontibacter sp. TaxID=453356 RepID=UPI00261F269A|nr:hypothetical protein [uncultured Pontibacter sp.]
MTQRIIVKMEDQRRAIIKRFLALRNEQIQAETPPERVQELELECSRLVKRYYAKNEAIESLLKTKKQTSYGAI